MLDIASPEYLFGRTDKKQQQERQQTCRRTFLDPIYGIHLRPCKIEKPRGHLVSGPEYSPKHCGKSHPQKDICRSPTESAPPVRPEQCGKQCQQTCRTGHHPPEIKPRRGQRRKHERPQDSGHGNSKNDFLHHLQKISYLY